MPQEEIKNEPVALTSTVSPNDVYTPTNISQIDIPSTNKAMDMKLSDLEKRLSKANSTAELNQIEIMNQPKAMGVLTGEAAYRSRLDTARVNAFNSLYNNRLLEEERKAQERQQFLTQYGADPSQRPKGMSKREFAKALQGGKFSNLLSEDFKQKQLQTAADKQSLSGGASGTVAGRQGAALNQAENAFRDFQSTNQGVEGYDGKVSPDLYIRQRQGYVAQGGTSQDFDSQFGQYLSPQEQQSLNIQLGGGNSVDQWAELLAKGQASVSNVPTTIRNEVVARVAELGSGVNKQLSDTAITNITQTEDALYSLTNLKESIRGNEEFLGPIAGWQKLNPWSKSRQVQADVDRVRQVVGKALEGGVLRKEDEEKYKKILATLLDTPATALYKIEALENDLKTKIENYKFVQSQSGRYVEGVTGVDQNLNQIELRTKYNY